MAEIQQKFYRNLTEEIVEAGHWVMLEHPKEVNEMLEKWLDTKF
jgi:soluble epoxide hydrolase/lipid-phosphate phosphatase